jgi:hypothetical protein
MPMLRLERMPDWVCEETLGQIVHSSKTYMIGLNRRRAYDDVLAPRLPRAVGVVAGAEARSRFRSRSTHRDWRADCPVDSAQGFDDIIEFPFVISHSQLTLKLIEFCRVRANLNWSASDGRVAD